jgi:hypothetical protein
MIKNSGLYFEFGFREAIEKRLAEGCRSEEATSPRPCYSIVAQDSHSSFCKENAREVIGTSLKLEFCDSSLRRWRILIGNGNCFDRDIILCEGPKSIVNRLANTNLARVVPTNSSDGPWPGAKTIFFTSHLIMSGSLHCH